MAGGIKVTITNNADELRKELESDLVQYRKDIKLRVFRALTLLETEIIQQIRRKAGLHVRTGALLNSISSSKRILLDSGGMVVGEIGPENIKYAAIHEFGGTIKPVNKQFLAIPIGANRRPDGMARITTQELMGGLGKSFIRDGIIYLDEGKKITPMFKLQRSVTIPARPYLSTALKAQEENIVKEFGLFLKAAFEKPGGGE
jgi:phage gpG-like protein